MTAETLAAALLRDVERIWLQFGPMGEAESVSNEPLPDHSEWLRAGEVLAALSRALDHALTDRAGEVLGDLRKGPEYVYRFIDTDHRAADLITALLAQNAALRKERDSARTYAAEVRLREKAAEDARIAAEAEVEKLRVLLEGWLELASQCDIAEGVCCCGESMEGHSNPMDCGHTPLDHGTYIAVQLGKETRAALTTEERT